MDVLASGQTLQYILVKFDNSSIVQKQRRKQWHIPKVSCNPDLVPIERFSFCYSLGDVNKKHGAKASLLQFPIRLSWAMTSHKCQGQSIMKPNSIFSDLNENFVAAQSYVILSRVTSLDQLFLLPFSHEKIYCSPEAKEEALKLQKKSINRQVTEWQNNGEGTCLLYTSPSPRD